MKIFGIGLSRTGTTSLNNLLVGIGYNVIHYPTEKQLWSTDNQGATDIPVINCYKQLDSKFPNSKFIYTVRDKQEWLDSIVPYIERKRQWKQSSWQIDNRTSIYSTPFPNKQQAEDSWNAHDADVRKYFMTRQDDLLVINIVNGDSPKSLYKFLDIASTESLPTAFPHSNKLNRK